MKELISSVSQLTAMRSRLLNMVETGICRPGERSTETVNCIDIDAAFVERTLAQGNLRRFDKQVRVCVLRSDFGAAQVGSRFGSPDAALYWLVRMLDGGC